MDKKHDTPRAWVLDLYGTLLDVHSVAGACERCFPGKGAELSAAWRERQLALTWLRSLMQRYTPFDVLTQQALAAACNQLGLDPDKAREMDLARAYLSLNHFPEVPESLRQLGKTPKWILSNGTQATVEACIKHSGLHQMIDGVLSVDVLRVYKPDPRVYALATREFDCEAGEIGFVSSNGWDICGAGNFGFRTFWINRAGLEIEPLDHHPEAVFSDLAGLSEMFGD